MDTKGIPFGDGRHIFAIQGKDEAFVRAFGNGRYRLMRISSPSRPLDPPPGEGSEPMRNGTGVSGFPVGVGHDMIGRLRAA